MEEIFQSLKNTIVSNIHTIAEPFVPLLTESQFNSTGTLTPEEFVAAGDLLVLKCPSWSWVSSNKTSYLPSNKQYLITKNVPKITSAKMKLEKNGDFSEITQDKFIDSLFEDTLDDSFLKDDSLDELEDSSLIKSGNILRTRTYDIHITYDRYYRGPKLWVYGRNEEGHPLSYEETLNDIGNDYVNKTATMETHPYIGLPYITVHNCRHADIIKKFSNGERPDKALFLFLKFMSSVIPNINYDFTVSFS